MNEKIFSRFIALRGGGMAIFWNYTEWRENGSCRVLTATKANKTERFIRSSTLLDTKSTHSLYARSHCSVPVWPARTTAVRYAFLLIQPLYTTEAISSLPLLHFHFFSFRAPLYFALLPTI